MAKPGLSFENPLYQASGGTPAGFANPYTGVNPAASSGSDALQRGLADIAVMGQTARQQIQTQFSMPGMQTPAKPPGDDNVYFDATRRKFYVNGVEIDEDDDRRIMDSAPLLGRPSVGAPQGSGWVAVPSEMYRGYIQEIQQPSLGRLASKNFGRGVDQLQMLAGRGLQLAGAEQLGGRIVEQQEQDLAKTAPYERQFTDIESGRGAVEWFVANLAQQGPNLLESVALGLAGAAAGTASAGPVGTAVGGLAGFFGKKAFKDKVLDAAQKYKAGTATKAQTDLLKNTAAVAGATAANFTSNVATGAADIYGEMREQGVGADDFGARLTALAGSLPYAGLDTVGEYFIASRMLGGSSGRAALPATATRRQRGAELLRRGATGFAVGAPLEGGTELGQEALVMGLSGQDLTSDAAITRFVNSFAAGAAIGGPLGAVANLRSKQPENLLNPGQPAVVTPGRDLVPVDGTGFTGFPRGGYTPAPPGTAVAPYFTPVTPTGAAPGAGGPPQMGGPATPTALGLPAPAQPITPMGGPVIMAGMGPGAADVTRQDVLLRQQGNVPPGAAPGSQGVLDIFGGTIPAQELAARMQPQQPLPGLPAPTPAVQPNPRQGALQFAGPAPVAPVNTQMGNQLQAIQDRLRRQQEFEAAQAQQAALIQQQTDAIAQASQNARDLYAMQQAQQAAGSQPMPMRQAGPTQPVQLPLFGGGLPRPTRGERLRAAQPLPTTTALPEGTLLTQPTRQEVAGETRADLEQERDQLQRIVAAYQSKGTNRITAPIRDNAIKRLREIEKTLAAMPAEDRGLRQASTQLPMFTQEGEPTLPALRAAGGKTKVAPTPPKPRATKTPGARGLKKGAKVAEVNIVTEEKPNATQTGKLKQGSVAKRQQDNAGVQGGGNAGNQPKTEVKAGGTKAGSGSVALKRGAKQAKEVKKEAPQPPKAVAAPAAAPASDADLDAGLRRNADDSNVAALLLADALVSTGHLASEMRDIALVYLTKGVTAGRKYLTDLVNNPNSGFGLLEMDDAERATYIQETNNFLSQKTAIFNAAAPVESEYTQQVIATYDALTDVQKAAVASELDLTIDEFNDADALRTRTDDVDDAIAAIKRRERDAARRAPAAAKAALAQETPQERWDAFALPGVVNYVDLPQAAKDAWDASDRSDAMQIVILDQLSDGTIPMTSTERLNFNIAYADEALKTGNLMNLADAMDDVVETAFFTDESKLNKPRIAEAQTYLNDTTFTDAQQGVINEAFLLVAEGQRLDAYYKGETKAGAMTPWFEYASRQEGLIQRLAKSGVVFSNMPQDKAAALLDLGMITTENLPDSTVKALGKTKPKAEQAAGSNPKISPAVKLAEKIKELNTSSTERRADARTKVINELAALWKKVRDDDLQTTEADALLGRPLSAYFDADGKPITNVVGGKLRVATTKMSAAEITALEQQTREEQRLAQAARDKQAKEDVRSFLDEWVDDADQGRFRTAEGKRITKALAIGRIRMAVNKFRAKLAVKPNIFVYANQADLKAKNPTLYKQAAASRPQGDFDTVAAAGFSVGKNVIIFSDRFATEDQLNFVLAHETVGHFGLRSLIPAKQFDALMESIYDQNPSVRDAADAAMATRDMPKAEAVEEYLSDFAAALDVSLINRIWNAIKGALNKLGVKFGDDAARYWVNQARRYVRNGEVSNAFLPADVFTRMNALEGGLDPDNTGRFALAGTLRADNMAADLMADTLGGMPTSMSDAAKQFRDLVGDSLDSVDKFKARFFSLLNFRARENPGLAELDLILRNGRGYAMSIKNAANERMAVVLNRAVSIPGTSVEFAGITEEQTTQVNKMLYDAQRYSIAKLKPTDLGKAPLFSVASDGTVVPNQPELDRVYKLGIVGFDQAKNGYSYKISYEQDGATVTETVNVPGIADLDENGPVWQGYLRTRETLREVEMQLLRARYAAFTQDRDLAFREIGDATKAKKLTSGDQRFLEKMYRKYRDLWTADQVIDEDGNPAFNADSIERANDFLVAFNTALLGKQSDRNAAVAAFFEGTTADDVIASLNDFKTRLILDEANKFIVQNKLKDIIVAEVSNDGADLYTKNTLASGYVPLLREGEYQVRVVATNKSGKVVRLNQAYKEQLVFSQVETNSDARGLAGKINEMFGDKTYKVEAFNEDTRQYELMDVRLSAVPEAAITEVAAPPELNLNEFIRGLRQFSIALNPQKLKEIVVALTRQNNSARNRLKRAFTPGASPDALKAISQHIESRASTSAKILMRPKINELMNLNMTSTQKLWNGDKAKLDQLKANYDRALADPQATDSERLQAKMDYQTYNFQYQKTNPKGESARGNQYYNEAAGTLSFLDNNKNVDESDFGSGKVASNIRAYTSLLQLGGSLATGALNYIGAITNGIPYLATYNDKTSFGGGFGLGRSLAEFQKALGQVGLLRALPGIGEKGLNTAEFYDKIAASPELQKKFGLTSSEARFMATEIRSGEMIPAQSSALVSSARGRASTGAGQKAMDGWMWTFNMTEQGVRRGLGLAAYRLQYERSRGAGMTEADSAAAARDFAVSTLRFTVGDYSVMNRPPAWRSGIQSFLYMYKVFVTTSIQMLSRLPRSGQLYMLVAMFLLGGLMSFPFAEDIEDLIDTIAQGLGLKMGSVRAELAKAIDSVAPGISPYVLRGFANDFLGVNLADRVSLSNFIPGTGMLLAGADVGRELTDIAGPAASMLTGVASSVPRFIQAAFTDRVTFVDALRESPVTMARALGDTIAYGQAGAVIDKRGYVVSPDAGALLLATRMLGFYPASAAEQYDIIRVSKRITDYQKETVAGFRSAWIKAKINNDPEQVRAVEGAVESWNEGSKGTALEIKNFVSNAQRALREAQRPAGERLLRASPVASRDDLEQIANLLGYND
jgi:hypothetical protein